MSNRTKLATTDEHSAEKLQKLCSDFIATLSAAEVEKLLAGKLQLSAKRVVRPKAAMTRDLQALTEDEARSVCERLDEMSGADDARAYLATSEFTAERLRDVLRFCDYPLTGLKSKTQLVSKIVALTVESKQLISTLLNREGLNR